MAHIPNGNQAFGSKVAIVVPRCHESIVGGSEALAWQYAELLRDTFEVDVLTSRALDYVTWDEVLPEGVEERAGVRIRRFGVTVARSPHWHGLHARWQEEFARANPGRDGAARWRSTWGLEEEEEFIRHQGPYSEPLLRFLARHGRQYHTVLLVPYLYPTTYFAASHVLPSRCVLVPALHDEPVAYLRAFRQLARRVRAQVWLTEAERTLSLDLWGNLPGRVVGMAIDADPAAPAQPGYPYLLYCGRIDTAKGTDQLLDYFLRWKEQCPSAVRLVLTGDDKLGLPGHPDVVYLRAVSADEKFALMAGASAFVMPSRWESFSIATLEAMAQGAPVLVNGACDVLLAHVARSGAGTAYRDHDGFCAALADLLAGHCRDELGARGREYVRRHYRREPVRDSLLQAMASCA
jgi:glycosyltransferase involved in cell wall biosynthesis